MLRFIRQRSWFAWLGLFALAGQLVLTLGHMHAGRENSLESAYSGALSAQLEARGHASRAVALTKHHRETPADSNHIGGWCAYCWTMAQAASTILPTPARVRRQPLHQTFSLPHRTADISTGDEISPFQSRGPPLTSQA